VAEYLRWRRAEDVAAAAADPWSGRVDDAAADMIYEPVTVTRWRRTVPSVVSWRAWLHETFDVYDGMPQAIDRGDFDAIRGDGRRPLRTQADYLADVVPALARLLMAATGERAATAHLARLVGVSPRTVGRYRVD
jgi:hypothetical protein